MKNLKLFLFFIGILVLSSCATSYNTLSDMEDGISFKTFKTYQIIHDDHGFDIGANPINKQRIDRAVKVEMEDLGYKETDKPDLFVAWFVKVETKIEHGIYNTYYGRWRYPRAVEVYEYQVGSLVVDIIDASSGEVIWHGKASGKVTDNMPDVDKNIKEAINNMFKKYRKDTGINNINSFAVK